MEGMGNFAGVDENQSTCVSSEVERRLNIAVLRGLNV